MKIKNSQSGFTLIELLVVIAIFGLLASIVLTSLNGARKKARDARRVADLRQFNTAIQFYINNTGHAPYVGAYDCQSSNSGASECNQVNEISERQWNELAAELNPYMSKMPKDPCGINCYDGNDRKTYYAYAYLPPSTISQWCGCSASDDEYAIFAETMEVDSSILNITFNGKSTFGFVNHSMGTSF